MMLVKGARKNFQSFSVVTFNPVPVIKCKGIYRWRETIAVLRVIINYLEHTVTSSPRNNAYWKFTRDSNANKNTNLNSKEQTGLHSPHDRQVLSIEPTQTKMRTAVLF